MTSLVLALSFAVSAQAPKSSNADVVKPGAKLEKLWGEGSFTEGGAWDGEALLFSDIGNRIMRFDPETKTVSVHREPSGRANGMIFDQRGRFIVAEGANAGGNRRVSVTELDGTLRALADNYRGKKFNSPNDVAVDRRARVYFSDPRYVGTEGRELDFEAVFRVDPEGSVFRLETGALKPNGLVVSPDSKILYIADNGSKRRVLLACDLDIAGNPSNSRVIKDFGDGRGIDGMTITTDGRIVASAGSGEKGGVYVLSKDGKELGFIPVPESPTNVEFGGEDLSTLYITAGVSLYRIETTMTGFALFPPRQGRGR